MIKDCVWQLEGDDSVLSNLLFTKNNIERGLDAAWLRNDVISQNIANVDTPGYKRKIVQFEEFLNNEMKTGRISQGKSRLSADGIRITEDPTESSYRSDGNNVDIENEMALLAANSLRYNTMIQRMNGDFQKLKLVIRGGK
ncbi:MAG: flagellar basal body rod protein FlgB [Clostridiaceae bacterium]|jgi:flagellar basal-body rod protein FlgB|nr:flagellar basal body rod protein FlgB [Clostridiaceae bacterium]